MPAVAPAAAADAHPAQALMTVTQRPSAVFTHGQGSWLWDADGHRYLDLVQGWAVNTFGHAPALIRDVLTAQAGRLLQAGPGLHNDRAIALAACLTRWSGLDRCYFTTSGAEANEGAIKLARKFGQVHRGGAYEIITFENGFHGRTLAAMSASGKPGFERMFEPKVPGFPKAKLNDLASVSALIGPNTVGVMLEPIQGEAGVVEATPEFLKGLRTVCDQLGLLLIFDEIQTGIGRTGELWGHTAAGIKPDIMTLGKGLGGGVPVGALLAREGVCCFAPGDQGGTYTGNPLVCAVGLAVMEAVTAPDFLPAVRERGTRLRSGLQHIADRLGGTEVRGRGLLLALDLPLPEQATRVAEAARQQASSDGPGMLVNAVRPQRLRFVPALTLTDGEIDLALELLEDTIFSLH